ncbi:PQQ-binding-like beta-propeller repeat protein [Halarchaeum sp. CBA1220]|uniref:outer membrane protein assembly factor BamB family protein n=1 Tax=Halarchaeum sp. CBA1220 TaxID=1853682 RepID=UPI000F3A99A3|nr:PQQ-binding-like beta-propeller repeat protein [Halarchaeum sp. CBA1220]QLC33063.1 PQQ-binding-like beta-propeller repeat protein [Halarchaeum sp. CBA1220]
MPSNAQTRRGLLAATGTTALASLTGCIGRVVAGADRVHERDAPVGDVTGAWPTYQHDFANTGGTADGGPSGDPAASSVAAVAIATGTSVTLAGGRGVVGYSDGDGEAGAYRGFGLDSSTESWSVRYPYGKSTPTVAGDAVFVSTAEFVAAYDGRNGELCWRTDQGGYGAVSNAPVLAADTLLTDDGETVYGRDPATGEKRWHYDAGGSGAAVVARDGVAYTTVGTSEETTGVAALDPMSGEERWRRHGLPESTVPLVVGENHLYYAAHRGDVYALALDDGATEWRASVPLPENGSPYAAVSGDTLHVQSPDGALAAFDVTDGATKWARELDADLGPRPPVVAADTRFALGDETLYALDAASGETTWSLGLDVRPALMSAPSVRGSALYYAGHGRDPGVVRVSD